MVHGHDYLKIKILFSNENAFYMPPIFKPRNVQFPRLCAIEKQLYTKVIMVRLKVQKFNVSYSRRYYKLCNVFCRSYLLI